MVYQNCTEEETSFVKHLRTSFPAVVKTSMALQAVLDIKNPVPYPTPKPPPGVLSLDLLETLMGYSMRGNTMRTDLESLSFHNITPNLRTGQFSNVLLGHFDGKVMSTLSVYQIDIPEYAAGEGIGETKSEDEMGKGKVKVFDAKLEEFVITKVTRWVSFVIKMAEGQEPTCIACPCSAVTMVGKPSVEVRMVDGVRQESHLVNLNLSHGGIPVFSGNIAAPMWRNIRTAMGRGCCRVRYQFEPVSSRIARPATTPRPAKKLRLEQSALRNEAEIQ
ncbi:MAG: hypothetical protein M1827_005308 [Pycnora praestabilis]|nr:MAG: hypothetical protein M1827_005308 [Pycnora praestabilis]